MSIFKKKYFNKIGEHQYGCREVLCINYLNALITGGWDYILKLWDLNTNNLIKTYQFNNKIYSMSYAKNLLVIALSENVMDYFKNSPKIIFISSLNIKYAKKIRIINKYSFN